MPSAMKKIRQWSIRMEGHGSNNVVGQGILFDRRHQSENKRDNDNEEFSGDHQTKVMGRRC